MLSPSPADGRRSVSGVWAKWTSESYLDRGDLIAAMQLADARWRK